MEHASKPFYPVFLICPTWKPINNTFFRNMFWYKKQDLKMLTERSRCLHWCPRVPYQFSIMLLLPTIYFRHLYTTEEFPDGYNSQHHGLIT